MIDGPGDLFASSVRSRGSSTKLSAGRIWSPLWIAFTATGQSPRTWALVHSCTVHLALAHSRTYALGAPFMTRSNRRYNPPIMQLSISVHRVSCGGAILVLLLSSANRPVSRFSRSRRAGNSNEPGRSAVWRSPWLGVRGTAGRTDAHHGSAARRGASRRSGDASRYPRRQSDQAGPAR